VRDITLGETVDFKFTTTEPDTGAPATLSGTPVISAYVGNSTTQITAGITLSVDFDGVTGLNNVRVVASSGNGYTDTSDVALIITTGTVDSVSAVGYKVAEFTIGRAAAYTRLGAPAGASVSADIAAIEAQTDDIGAAGAGLTAIPWNANWDAEVQSEVTDALNAYDPPTNAELVSEINAVQADIAALNDISSGDVETAVLAALDTDITATPTAGSINDVLNDLDARLPGSGTLSILTAAAVNAEVVDALATDTYAEPGQGAPAATATLAAKIGYLYKAWRNKSTQTADTYTLFADDATTTDQKATISDDATTFTRGEVGTGA
jgi:hypothetical protein